MNARATDEPSTRHLDALSFERTLTSDDLLSDLRDRLPAATVPRVVVLDNAGIHTSRVVRAARPELAKFGIFLYYLPPYSPEFNRIEAVFKQIKHHEMPVRSHKTREDLKNAVEDGFDAYRRKLAAKGDKQLRSSAYTVNKDELILKLTAVNVPVLD